MTRGELPDPPLSRFPPDAETFLRRAGWYPGRSIPDSEIDRYTERLRELTADDPPVAVVTDTARAIMREFGSLTITHPDWMTWTIQPLDEDPDLWLFGGLDCILGQAVTPVGNVTENFETVIIVSDDGRVFYG